MVVFIERLHVISASDLRKGSKFLYKNEPHIVLEFQHVKQANRRAFTQVKIKNMINGSIYEDTFRSDEKFPEAGLEHKTMLYLYADGDDYHFMDQETYDQVALSKKQLEDVMGYLKEQTVYDMLYFSDRPIAITPPLFMELKVTEAPPGVRGDTAQGAGTKQVTLETGLVLQVPLFINTEDVLKIDTRDGKYIER